MDTIRLLQSVFAIMIAAGLAKFGNENYELLKAEGSILIPIACLIGAIVLGIYGIILFFRSLSRR